jgi:hypothetical protein
MTLAKIATMTIARHTVVRWHDRDNPFRGCRWHWNQGRFAALFARENIFPHRKATEDEVFTSQMARQ